MQPLAGGKQAAQARPPQASAHQASPGLLHRHRARSSRLKPIGYACNGARSPDTRISDAIGVHPVGTEACSTCQRVPDEQNASGSSQRSSRGLRPASATLPPTALGACPASAAHATARSRRRLDTPERITVRATASAAAASPLARYGGTSGAQRRSHFPHLLPPAHLHCSASSIDCPLHNPPAIGCQPLFDSGTCRCKAWMMGC